MVEKKYYYRLEAGSETVLERESERYKCLWYNINEYGISGYIKEYNLGTMSNKERTDFLTYYMEEFVEVEEETYKRVSKKVEEIVKRLEEIRNEVK